MIMQNAITKYYLKTHAHLRQFFSVSKFSVREITQKNEDFRQLASFLFV